VLAAAPEAAAPSRALGNLCCVIGGAETLR
jgi:hypothetical protein